MTDICEASGDCTCETCESYRWMGWMLTSLCVNPESARIKTDPDRKACGLYERREFCSTES